MLNELIPITLIAKNYGMSAKALNQKLSQLKIQYKCGKTWALYQPYAHQGYTKSLIIQVTENKCVTRTYWTPKGKLFLDNLLNATLTP